MIIWELRGKKSPATGPLKQSLIG
ncbi:hypothetical protein PTD2_13234 [Pseudoalteromonas tunicata D2]|uniref:Uncharacterized protein n=1 Tax=Pseudoalteromonas tunicata D2 TaxID=87626 RepID=A4C731_9GAMM|nr:hypothetical protein PTD2_13234 [Pseudoalteromonas tunicata D2]